MNDENPDTTDDAAASSVDTELDAAPVEANQGDSDTAEDAAPVENQPGVNVTPTAPGNEERASRLSTGAAAEPESASEDRYRQSSDEPYKDHGNRAEGVSSRHSDSSEPSKIDDGYEDVADGVKGRASGQHGAVDAADTGTGSNTEPS